MANILIVDDDPDFTDAASTVLRHAGHTVEVLAETEAVVERLKEQPPDLLILDVMFPEHSSAGFDLAREIRRDQALRRIPILMLTAVNTRFPLGFGPEDIDEEWLPVQDFLEKPVDFDLLLERIARLLGTGGGHRPPPGQPGPGPSERGEQVR